MDHQVKIRGFRIELGEIEKQLTAPGFPLAREAVVTAGTDASGEKRLVAYIVPDETTAYTVCRKLDAEDRQIDEGISSYQWPNGMPVYYLNRGETDFMYQEIFEERSYLKHGITIKDGDCIFDIGANIGVFSLFALRRGQNARIYAFEPLPPVYRVLALNASLYKGNIQTFNCALGSEKGETTFTYYPHASILSGSLADKSQETETVKAFMQKQQQETDPVELTEEQYTELLDQRLTTMSYTCPIKTLSQVMRENNVESIDLLKIDVEKAEMHVLEGIDPEHWPRIRQLVIEVHQSAGDNLLERITRLLENNGYTVAVEQEQLLTETRLYNLYAIREPRREDERQEPEEKTVHEYFSIDRLVRDTREYLSGKLPDYMVPAHIVPLARLPLTPNGKVDRKALPQPEIRLSERYAAPVTGNQQLVARVWREVLGLEKVGIDDNFFQLGGHSLKATIAVSEINRLAGARVPLVEMFKNPTVRALAQYIENLDAGITGINDENLVLLKKSSPDAGNLFLIHDGSGEVEGYVDFCQTLTAPFNCWGVRADKPEGYGPRNLSIEEVAAGYLKKITGLQPQGPYYIAGWSMGGTIAFEMVRQLEAKGERAAFFAMIDTAPPRSHLLRSGQPFDLQSESDFISRYLPGDGLKRQLKDTANLQEFWEVVVRFLETGNFDPAIIRRVIVEYEAHVVPGYQGLSIASLVKYLNMGRTFARARGAYQPDGTVDTPIRYFGASSSTKINNVKHKWRDYAGKTIKMAVVQGDHFSIFKPPAVAELAKLFADELNETL
jgi:FkbM family methyltransferase